jgi:hypothetical protein
MKLKPRPIRNSIAYYLTAIAAAGLVGVPAFSYGAGNAFPPTKEYKFPQRSGTIAKSRAEVLQELRQAKRRGNFVANNESGKKAYQLYPSAYPSHEQQYKSRAEVLRELRKAERRGNYMANNESGRKANQMYESG